MSGWRETLLDLHSLNLKTPEMLRMPFDIWMERECAVFELGLKCPRVEEDGDQHRPGGVEITTTIEADLDLLLVVDFQEAGVALIPEADPELVDPDLIPENVDKTKTPRRNESHAFDKYAKFGKEQL